MQCGVFDPQACVAEAATLLTRINDPNQSQSNDIFDRFLLAKRRMLRSYEATYDSEIRGDRDRRIDEKPSQKDALNTLATAQFAASSAKATDLEKDFVKFMETQKKGMAKGKRQARLQTLYKRFGKDCITDAKKYLTMLKQAGTKLKKIAPILQDKLQPLWKEKSTKDKVINSMWRRMETQLRSDLGAQLYKTKQVLLSQNRTTEIAKLVNDTVGMKYPQHYFTKFKNIYKHYRALMKQ